MYQALYRKWRPRAFADVAGQEHITQTLRRQAQLGRLSHAYLFVGSRGTGKTSCAKILSRAVNCTDPKDGDPCNKCVSCVGIENGSILDVLEIDAASNNGVDNVRALREEAVYSPASVYKRVYIIDEVHMLSISAFNALLKLLEEPPEHLMFILATTELHKVPATILSRCQRFMFRRLKPDVITAQLKSVAEREGLTLTDDAAQKLAAFADGSMRDALSLLDQCASEPTVDLARVLDTIGLAGKTEILRLAETIAINAPAQSLQILDELYDDGRDMQSLLLELAALMRDVLVHKLAPDSPLMRAGFDGAELAALSKTFTPERLFYCLDTIRESLSGFSRGGSGKLAAEMCIIRMCAGSEAPAAQPPVAAQPRPAESAVKPAAESPAAQPSPEPPAVPEPAPIVEDSPPIETPVAVRSNAAQSSDHWRDILEFLKSDVPIYTLLGDDTKVQAEIEGGTLVIRAGNPFIVNTIESKTFSGPLREAARKTLGRDVVIRVESGGGADNVEDKRAKLDSLSAFDIIKFE